MAHAELSSAPTRQIDARIRAVLRRLRTRIRAYVVLEAFTAVLLWLGLTFWAGFAIDYLPVLLGANEMPVPARAVLLSAIAIGAAYIAYRRLVARLLVPLSDRSMAILLERRHQSFHDSLVTTVEMTGREEETDPLAQDMLAATGRHALEELHAARLSRVFNLAPLLRQVAFAGILVLAVVAAYAANASAVTKAARRLYLLDPGLWERFARIEVVGLEVRRASSTELNAADPQSLEFRDGRVKVARGSNVTLHVQADASAPVLPEQCLMNYRTAEGERGTVTMKRVGRAREDRQLYVCDAKPLAGILSSLEFDVLGYDHRLRGFHIEVVESPVVVEAKMDLEYPSYMVDEQLAIHLPRQGEPVLASGNPLPMGTKVRLHLAASKPLLEAEVRVLDPHAADAASLEIERKTFTFSASEAVTSVTYDIPTLRASRTLELSLVDADGVASERPYRTFLTVVPDEPPRWELALQGIGTAVTPDVIIPLAGKVTDDYAVSSAWLDAAVGDAEPLRFELPREKGSEIKHSIDFRFERSQREALQLNPGDKLSLVARAVDRFDLSGTPNEGASQRYVLDVVTPDQLLIALESRELALRRRFEVIVEELAAMRDSLLRVQPGQAAGASTEPDELLEPGEKRLSAEEQARRDADLRVLRVQRAFQQSRKSAQEIEGVAQGFDGIREELTNNRVDTEDRKSRLQQQISDPLHAIASTEFPQLDELLLRLEPLANDAQQGPPSVDAAVAKANSLLASLDQVLQKMLKLESYNEIVDMVRDLIREQNALIDDTRRQQRRDLVED